MRETARNLKLDVGARVVVNQKARSEHELRLGMVMEMEERSLRDKVLREGETNFRIVAEMIAPAIFIRRGTRLRHVNHAAEVIAGYTREAFLSMSFGDLPILRLRRLPRGFCFEGRVGEGMLLADAVFPWV